MTMKHASHPEIIKRLKRAEGHLRSLIGMIEAGKPCLDLAQQLHAVEAAIANAKRELIHDHIDHCLEDAMHADTRSARAALAEFKALSKYL
jgi:DNA-binding FrmR family transcriptional regulator